MKLLTLTLGLLTTAALPLRAQIRPPTTGQLTISLGQPEMWKWHAGAATGWTNMNGEATGLLEARLGVFHDILLNPTMGFLGLDLEGFVGAHETRIDRGVRARVVSPALRFGVGADYNGDDGRTRLVISGYNAVRRGGLFLDGSLLRVDYFPLEHRKITIGVESPIGRRAPMGRTRPHVDHIELTGPRPAPLRAPDAHAEIDAQLASARELATWIRRVSVPFLDQNGGWRGSQSATTRALRALKAGLAGRSFDAEVGRYHTTLERAFTLAIGDAPGTADAVSEAGARVAAKARALLLTEVLLPYDRLLGQEKRADHLDPFTRTARGLFARWLQLESGVPGEKTDAVMWVFASTLAIVESNRAAARAEWNDSRFVWLPLDYALRPEDHDSQAELDGLLEQAVGETFTEGNVVSYVINEQFQYQLSRTIHDARDYHVLWTHDFRGLNKDGHIDAMSYAHVLRSYLSAMTERVRAYDSTGTFPTYIVLLDQWFYEVNFGRLWMTLLENPTTYQLRLPAEHKAWEDSIADAQRTLRDAITGSKLLQAQRRQFGDAWLRNLIKVHVNITNPADPSFWSPGVVPAISVADNMMRDHRKVAFYDVTEAEPYRGAALFTGAGIGEHYSSTSWEDRAMLVRGPSLLALKTDARALLLAQGFRASDIPFGLQPVARGAHYDERIAAMAEQLNVHTLRTLTVTNNTGFGSKELNAAKGVLYTLMPAGSVIKIPDSLWDSYFWGSALLGCALRGGRVVMVAPSYDNAPAQASGSMIRSQELFSRLAIAGSLLGPEIATAGGLLKVGLYTSEIPVTDIGAKIVAIQKAFREQAWLRDFFGFDARAYAALDELSALATVSMKVDTSKDFTALANPKLHLKVNFIASREAWSLMHRPEWGQTIREFASQRIAQVQDRQHAVSSFDHIPDPIIDPGTGMVEDWFSSLDSTTRSRAVFYTVLGSQNQSYRSMASDGEIALIVSDWPNVAPLLDFIALMAKCKWADSPADITPLYPSRAGVMRLLARQFKLMF